MKIKFAAGIVGFVILSVVLSGCLSSPFYQNEESLPGNTWPYQYRPSFKFEISDTSSYYNLYFLIRHTEAYPFENIWVWVYAKQPGDSTFEKTRIEIPLAERSGKWLGRGMGEIWEQRMPIALDKTFKKGVYEVRFEQNMRVNPLPEVLHVGLRIEKAGPRNFTAHK